MWYTLAEGVKVAGFEKRCHLYEREVRRVQKEMIVKGEHLRQYPGWSDVRTFSAYLFNVHASDVIDEQAADGVLMASSQRQSRRQSFSSEHPSKLIQDHPKVTDSFEPDGLVMIGI